MKVENLIKKTNQLQILLLLVLIIAVIFVSCKKEDYDYRDKWVGRYSVTSIHHVYHSIYDNGATCGDYTYNSGAIWEVSRGSKEDELNISIFEQESDIYEKKIVLVLNDTLGNFVEMINGDQYEKGSITNRCLYYETYKISDSTEAYDAELIKTTGEYCPDCIY